MPSDNLSPFARITGAASILSDTITVYYLRRVRGGPRPILDRMPAHASAVYAWFRDDTFPDPETASTEDYVSEILRILGSPHCAPRTARMAPHFRVELTSFRELTDTKIESMRALCELTEFRTTLARVAELGILFQAPLYIGKTNDLRGRIERHLQSDSDLRTRLAGSGVDIENCALLTIAVPATAEVQGHLEASNVIEDLLSRIYLPHFSLRYG